MAHFVLEWRQNVMADGTPTFITRRDYANDVRGVKSRAAEVRALAWREEFRLGRGGLVVHTDLRQIEDWQPDTAAMPAESPSHVWREDLDRDMVADRFLEAVRRCVVPAVNADVLLSRDGEALVRFACTSVRRPAL